MTTRQADVGENPVSPSGWAVGPVNPADARGHAPGELMGIEQQKRRDTAEWVDANDANPVANEGTNPAQPPGWAVPADAQVSGAPANEAPMGPVTGKQIIARVFTPVEATSLEGAKVLLRDKDEGVTHVGRIVASTDDAMWVRWQDNELTTEMKLDYELFRTDLAE